MMHHFHARFRALILLVGLTGILAAPCAANTTFSNLVNAPVAGNSILVLGPTTYGGFGSQEVVEALNLGFDVVVNDNATWSTMTTANFATYRAIVMGDPYCDGTTTPIAAAVANRTVWSPAVTGNILITGTDEALHAESSFGAKDRGSNLKRRGIYFAANNPAKTGAFVSLSCYYDGAPVTPQALPLMDQFGTFMIHGQLGCYNNAHIVGTAPGLTGPSVGLPPVPLMLDANLSGWGCSMHEGFDSWPANFSVFAIGQNLTNVYSATDGTHGLPYILVSGERVDVITNIHLGPKTATNPVNTSHTVTATIVPAPPINTIVTFTVVAGPNIGATGTGNTNAGGAASWTYPDTGGPGTDYIVATWSDAKGTYTSNTVVKIWSPCVPPVFTITGPATGCTQGTYCVAPPPPGATYLWNVSNGTIVGPNNGPCVTINWNSPSGGVVTVSVSPGPNCPAVIKEIGVKPCDDIPPPCCVDVKLSAIGNGFVLGGAGSASFTPSLTVLAGLGPITKVVATINTTDRTFSSPGCGTPGPVNSFFIGSGYNPNFNAAIAQANGREMIWTAVPPLGVSLAVAQNFPMTIQFPAPPSWKCADYLTFCIRYEFTDVNCKVCEITACYGPFKRGGFIWWDHNIGTAVVGTPLRPQPVISLRDQDGNLIIDDKTFVTLSIVPGTGDPGAELMGKTTVQMSGGKANFQDLSIMKRGAGYRLRATLNDPEAGDITADSNEFNVLLADQVPIYHVTAPISIDGNITAAEWNGAPTISLNQATQDLLPGHWTGLPDYSAQVKLKWDADNLYFATFVADDVVSLPASADSTDLLGRDGLQMFLRLSNHQHGGGETYTDEDFDVRISADPPGAGTPDYAGIANSPQSRDALKSVLNVIRFVRLSGGYAIEGSLPWSQPNAWTYTPAVGGVIGFNLQGRDNDQSVPNTDTIMSLTGLPGAETTPNTWTTAILLGDPPAAGDVNGDGVVNLQDVTLALQIAGGSRKPGNGQVELSGADFNTDGKVTLPDPVRILRKINGL